MTNDPIQMGPMVFVCSGVTAMSLGSFSGYANSAGYIGDNVFISAEPNTAPWGGPTYAPWQPNPITTLPIPPPQYVFPVPAPGGMLTQHKCGIFYNREYFLEFVEKCRNKVLIFIDNGEEKVVEKQEALKIILQFFLAGKKYKNWDDFEYKDDEWHLFFRIANNASELLEAFDFSYQQIKEILCM
jgi:hypothetical protein